VLYCNSALLWKLSNFSSQLKLQQVKLRNTLTSTSKKKNMFVEALTSAKENWTRLQKKLATRFTLVRRENTAAETAKRKNSQGADSFLLLYPHVQFFFLLRFVLASRCSHGFIFFALGAPASMQKLVRVRGCLTFDFVLIYSGMFKKFRGSYLHSCQTLRKLLNAEVIIRRMLFAVSSNFAEVIKRGNYCHAELIKLFAEVITRNLFHIKRRCSRQACFR
jgi:hypothetical protein